MHYCVANMPGAVGRTSTFALCNVTLPWALRIANLGIAQAAQKFCPIASAVNIHQGRVTNEAVAATFELEYSPLSRADEMPATGSLVTRLKNIIAGRPYPVSWSSRQRQDRSEQIVTEAAKPLVGILMGSDSDWPKIKAAKAALDEFGVACEVHVMSAHRTPAAVQDYATTARATRIARDHRRGRWSSSPGRRRRRSHHASRDRPAGSDRRPGRARLAAVDRADAGRCPGGHHGRGHGRPAQRRPVRRSDPGHFGRDAGGASSPISKNGWNRRSRPKTPVSRRSSKKMAEQQLGNTSVGRRHRRTAGPDRSDAAARRDALVPLHVRERSLGCDQVPESARGTGDWRRRRLWRGDRAAAGSHR